MVEAIKQIELVDLLKKVICDMIFINYHCYKPLRYLVCEWVNLQLLMIFDFEESNEIYELYRMNKRS